MIQKIVFLSSVCIRVHLWTIFHTPKQKIRLRYVRKRIQAIGMMLVFELKMVSGTGFEPVLPP